MTPSQEQRGKGCHYQSLYSTDALRNVRHGGSNHKVQPSGNTQHQMSKLRMWWEEKKKGFCSFPTIRDQWLKMIKTQKTDKYTVNRLKILMQSGCWILTLKNDQINRVNSSFFLSQQLQVGVCRLSAFSMSVYFKRSVCIYVWWVTGNQQLMAFEWNTVVCKRYLFLQPLLFVLKSRQNVWKYKTQANKCRFNIWKVYRQQLSTAQQLSKSLREESPWPDPWYKVCKSSCTRKKKEAVNLFHTPVVASKCVLVCNMAKWL